MPVPKSMLEIESVPKMPVRKAMPVRRSGIAHKRNILLLPICVVIGVRPNHY